jgi:hypothetical protein
MIKVEKKDQNVKPFGGINFVIDDLRTKKVDEFIDNELGSRSPQAAYSYSDVIKAMLSIFLCGGDAAEDIEAHLKGQLLDVPEMKVMSADTILRALKELATEKVIHDNNGVLHEYNDNPALNKLNIKVQKKLGFLREGCYYDLDFDHQLTPNEKFDSKMSYKKASGYFPGNASINDLIVYTENRNGNSNVKYLQDRTLEKIFACLDNEGIKVGRFRADCGSYINKCIEISRKNCKHFYIRAQQCELMRKEISSVKKWEQVEINNITYEVASIDYNPFGNASADRLVIQRTTHNHGQGNLFTGDARVYRSIICNDFESSEKEVIEFYNERGTSEKVFDVMNNDFGWSKLPFSFMNENTVFMIVTTICRVIYQWLINRYSLVFPGLKPVYRLKKFVFRFITVCAKWVKGQRNMKLVVYDDRPYEKIATIPL